MNRINIRVKEMDEFKKDKLLGEMKSLLELYRKRIDARLKINSIINFLKNGRGKKDFVKKRTFMRTCYFETVEKLTFFTQSFMQHSVYCVIFYRFFLILI